MKIDLDEVRRVAELAHIRLNDDELPRMAAELSVILDYIDQLSTVDVDLPLGIAMANPTSLREDVVVPSLPVTDVAANAPAFVHGHFVVPRVIGGE